MSSDIRHLAPFSAPLGCLFLLNLLVLILHAGAGNTQPLPPPDLEKTKAVTAAWDSTRQNGTISSYRDFLKRFPENDFVNSAIDSLLRLFPIEWKKTQQQDSLEIYFSFWQSLETSSKSQARCAQLLAEHEPLVLAKILEQGLTDKRGQKTDKILWGNGDGTTLVEFLPDRMQMVIWATSGVDFYVLGKSPNPLRLRQGSNGLVYEGGVGIVLQIENGAITKIFQFGV